MVGQKKIKGALEKRVQDKTDQIELFRSRRSQENLKQKNKKPQKRKGVRCNNQGSELLPIQ